MSEKEILDDYPELEPDDFPAIYDFAAHMGKRGAATRFSGAPVSSSLIFGAMTKLPPG